VLADIPGLVEGASEGVGLGHDFLRHVERTRLLFHVVDISGSEGRDPVEDVQQINHELASYGDLANRPQLMVANKTDLTADDGNLQALKAWCDTQGLEVFPVSAATRQGFDALLDRAAQLLETLPPIQHFVEEAVADEADQLDDTFSVRFADGAFEVEGPAMEHLINSVNFEDEESVNWFHRTLRRLGVIDELRRNGAGEGATVRIADMEFDFID